MKVTKEMVQGLVGSTLVSGFDGKLKTPAFHEEVWELCTSHHKFVAIAAPRGHAKSTAVTLSYGLSTLLFREREFMLVVSDTESQACLFLGQIKQTLQENNDLIDLFGIKRNPEGLVKFVKESESDIIVEFTDGHKFRIIAKGAEQKLRGLLWSGKRPDIIICDDLENDEIVMNKDRREKFKRWFYGALLPCRSKDGIVRYVGTILHLDSMLENFMPRENDAFTVVEDLKVTTTRKTLWKSVKYKAHNSDFSQILWPEKFSASELKELKNDYSERGIADVYSQEYLNVPIDESNTYFKKSDFLPVKEEDRKKKLNYYITADLAISLEERADWSVFMIGGVDEDGFLHIKNVIRARMDGLEIADTVLALQKIYDPYAIGIEEGQISKSVGPFLNREMVARNVYPNIEKLKTMGQDKVTRAKSIQARMRAGGVKFDKSADWYQTLEDECMTFPRSKHDDQVDTLAYMGRMIDKLIEAPTPQEQSDIEYEDELRNSDIDQGRNEHTGY
jgi:predicted phage terminase large subunit-like protein